MYSSKSITIDTTWRKENYLKSDTNDVRIVVCNSNDSEEEFQPASFPASSSVLRSESVVFSATLDKKNFIEGCTGNITLDGYRPRVVEYFLRYLYLSEFPGVILHTDLIELLRISHQYEVKNLVGLCNNKLMETISVDVACEVYDLAEILNLQALRKTCIQTILYNFQYVLNNNLHFVLKKDSLEFIISNLSCTGTKFHPSCFEKALLRRQFWIACFEDVKSEEAESSEHCNPDLSKFGYSEDYKDYKIPDVRIVTNEGLARFPAHSIILASKSECFKELIEKWKTKLGNDNTVEILLDGLNERAAEYLLRFIYTGGLSNNISEDNLISLIIAAERYKIPKLLSSATYHLVDKLSYKASFQALEMTSKMSNETLELACLKIFSENSEKPIASNLYFELGKENLIRFLSKRPYSDLESPKISSVLEEWTKWRLCMEGKDVNLKNISSMSDPILARVVAISLVRRLDGFLNIHDLNRVIIDSKCSSHCLTLGKPFDLMTSSVNERVRFDGFKMYWLGTSSVNYVESNVGNMGTCGFIVRHRKPIGPCVSCPFSATFENSQSTFSSMEIRFQSQIFLQPFLPYTFSILRVTSNSLKNLPIFKEIEKKKTSCRSCVVRFQNCQSCVQHIYLDKL